MSLSQRNALKLFASIIGALRSLGDSHFNPKKKAQMSLSCREGFSGVVLRAERRAGESEQKLSCMQFDLKTLETPISLVKSNPMRPEGRPKSGRPMLPHVPKSNRMGVRMCCRWLTYLMKPRFRNDKRDELNSVFSGNWTWIRHWLAMQVSLLGSVPSLT
jgi:hypothetical protein